MNHYDEHIIELYVLRSETVEDRREEIERHLAECHGCRSLATEIEQFYAGFEKALAEPKDAEPINPTALARAPRSLEPYFEPYTAVSDLRESSLTGRMRYFIRRYPIAVGTSGFVLAAALVGLAFFRPWGAKEPSDTNPAYHHINPDAGTVEIYNRENEKIREFPTKLAYNVESDAINKLDDRIQVTDLDGDGRREIIIGFAIGGQDARMSPLNILSADGATLRELRFSNYLEWNGSKYADSQSVEAYTISGSEGSADREIFVVANNIRSPNTMYRLSKNGDILGEYNHFGAAYPIMVNFPGSSREFLVLYGQNDTREPDSLSHPVMIVLDPSKITGKSEAGDSRGFGLPVSNAEEYIVRFPLSDLNHLLLSQGYASSLSVVTQETQTRLLFVTGGSYSDPDFMLHRGPGFHFYLDGDFRVVEVKYDTPTMKLRKRMIEDGRLADIPVGKYLSDLKEAVLYWNGTGWQKEPTTVRGRPDA